MQDMALLAHCGVPEMIHTLVRTLGQLSAARKCQDDASYFALLRWVPSLPVDLSCLPALAHEEGAQHQR